MSQENQLNPQNINQNNQINRNVNIQDPFDFQNYQNVIRPVKKTRQRLRNNDPFDF